MNDLSAWIGVVGVLGAGIGVWVKLIERLTAVETRQKSDHIRFEEIMEHLRRIEDKLDKRAQQ